MKLFFTLFSFLMISGFVYGQSSSEAELIEKANFLLQNQRYDDAILMLDEALKKNPSSADLHFRKAEAYLSLSRFKNAVDELEASVQKKPDFYTAYEMLGNLYFQFRDAERAVKNYDLAFQTDDDIERKLLYKLNILDILDKLDRHRYSIKHIEDAKAIMGENFDLLYYQVLYHNEMGEHDKAYEIMKKLLEEVNPTSGNEQYFYQMAIAAQGVKKYEEVPEYLKNADGGEYRVKLRYFTPEYFLSLARAYFEIYEYSLADEFVRIALAIDPKFTDAFDLQRNLEAIKTPKGKIIETIENSLKAEKNPDRIEEKRNELIYLYYQNEDFVNALRVADEYLDVNPRDIKVVFMKAIIEDKLNKHDEAIENLYKITRNPKLPPQLKATFGLALGRLLKNAKQYERAEKVLRDAYGGDVKDAVQFEVDDIKKRREIEEIENM
jgi:tetratricopeptide (TPR) repeat protein